LWVELGLQSIHNRTLQWIGRGHDYAQFLSGLERLHSRGIRVCVHLILGLPGETKADMLASAQAAAKLPIQGIKLHLLHVLRGTPLAVIYRREPFKLMSKEDYVSLIADILEILPPEMIIHRLTGDGPPDDLIGPLWSRKKWEVLNAIDAELARRDTWQGKKVKTGQP
jgi:radical SAM protein (TIGR01212 family)